MRTDLLTTASILSLEDAVEALPGDPERNRRWLRERGLVRDLPPPVVVWGDVVEAVRAIGQGHQGQVEARDQVEVEARQQDQGDLEVEPVTSWTAAARVLGVSSRTIRRRRDEKGDTSSAWWASPDDCRRWWSKLLGETPQQQGRGPARGSRSRHVRRGVTLADLRAGRA